MTYVDTWRGGHHAINAYDTDMNLFPGVKLGHPNDNGAVAEKTCGMERDAGHLPQVVG